VRDHRIAMEPRSFDEYERAVTQAGAELVPLDSSVEALIWTDYARPELLRATLDANHNSSGCNCRSLGSMLL